MNATDKVTDFDISIHTQQHKNQFVDGEVNQQLEPLSPLFCYGMPDLSILVAFLLNDLVRLPRPNDTDSVVAGSLLTKQHHLISDHYRKCASGLTSLDRFLFEFWSLFLAHR